MKNCTVCGRPKEPTREKSQKCRSCDATSKTGRTKPSRRLTIDLPTEVWERLDAEAALKGKRIAGHLQDLIITRDAKRVSRNRE